MHALLGARLTSGKARQPISQGLTGEHHRGVRVQLVETETRRGDDARLRHTRRVLVPGGHGVLSAYSAARTGMHLKHRTPTDL